MKGLGNTNGQSHSRHGDSAVKTAIVWQTSAHGLSTCGGTLTPLCCAPANKILENAPSNKQEKEEAKINVRGVRLRQVFLGRPGSARGDKAGAAGLKTVAAAHAALTAVAAARLHRIVAIGKEAQGGCSSYFSDIKTFTFQKFVVVAQKNFLNSKTQLSGARRHQSAARSPWHHHLGLSRT